MENIADGVNQSFVDLTYKNGLGNYVQSNCTATLTGQGLLIHRPANVDGTSDRSVCGGLVLSNSGNRFGLVQGRTYILKVHVVGTTSNSTSDMH